MKDVYDIIESRVSFAKCLFNLKCIRDFCFSVDLKFNRKPMVTLDVLSEPLERLAFLFTACFILESK